MDGKVLLLNSDSVKIGETFFRRAAQLVRQQRAEWTDDSQMAVRFHPGKEIATKSEAKQSDLAVSPLVNGLLANEFERRIKEREKFVIHSFSLVPGFIVILVAWYAVDAMLGVTWGFYQFYDLLVAFGVISCVIWITAYLIHAYLFVTNKRARIRIAAKLNMQVTTQNDKL